jgi:uncharacterized membrane protein YcfT
VARLHPRARHTAATSISARTAWLDAAKGIGIVLVVFVQLSVIGMLGNLVDHPAPFSLERCIALVWKPTPQLCVIQRATDE